MRNQMDEDDLKKVIKTYPHTRRADLAAYDLIDNKLCGDWQGSEQVPRKRIGDLRKICAPSIPTARAPRKALYEAVYRQAVLADMYAADGNDKKQDEAHNHARDLAARLKDKFPQSDYTWRAAGSGVQIGSGRSGLRHRPPIEHRLIGAWPKSITAAFRRLFERLHSVHHAGHC